MISRTAVPGMTQLAEQRPATLRVYRALMTAATPLAAVWLSRRVKQGKEDVKRLTERYGESRARHPGRPLIWIHAASVGELLSVIPLMARLRERGFQVLSTTGTVTSANLAEQRLPQGVIHQFIPLDMPRFVARFLDRWKPDLGLFVESDLWPNLIMGSGERRIPLIVVNARLSARSAHRWRRLPHTITNLLGMFDLCLAQSADDAARLRDLGAPRITTTGNLKLDVPEPPVDEATMATLRTAIAGRAVLAAASTHPGEEEAIVEVHRRLRNTFSGLLTIIVPRHPHRGPEIADLAAAEGLSCRLRSAGDLPDANTEIYVADTMGELGMIYRLVPIVFMGGSLVEQGGHNPIEAIKLGAAVLHGPHVKNFGAIYEALDKAGGADLVPDVGKLTVRVGALLSDAVERQQTCTAAQQVIAAMGGALNRTLAALEPYLADLSFADRDFGDIPDIVDDLDFQDGRPLLHRHGSQGDHA